MRPDNDTKRRLPGSANPSWSINAHTRGIHRSDSQRIYPFAMAMPSRHAWRTCARGIALERHDASLASRMYRFAAITRQIHVVHARPACMECVVLKRYRPHLAAGNIRQPCCRRQWSSFSTSSSYSFASSSSSSSARSLGRTRKIQPSP